MRLLAARPEEALHGGAAVRAGHPLIAGTKLKLGEFGLIGDDAEDRLDHGRRIDAVARNRRRLLRRNVHGHGSGLHVPAPGCSADGVSARGQDLRERPFERQCEKGCESRSIAAAPNARPSQWSRIRSSRTAAQQPLHAGIHPARHAVVNRTVEEEVNSRSPIFYRPASCERRDLRREPHQQLLRLLEQRLDLLLDGETDRAQQQRDARDE